MFGNLLIIFSFLITTTLFLLSKESFDNIPTLTFFAQYSALIASISISINYMLAIKNKFIEKLFSGFDNVYRNHILLGNLGFIFAILHVIFLITSGLPFNLTSIYLVPSIINLPYTFGMLSLYSLIVFVSLTIFVKLPYKLWKSTHQFIILVVIFSFLHAFTIPSDVAVFLPLRYWILSFNLVAIIAYVYRRFLFNYFVPMYKYKVEKVDIDKDYVLLSLKNTESKKIIDTKGGQYVFISEKNDKRNDHPFSILESKDNSILLGAKVVGSFTSRLKSFEKEQIINVYGPFGYFSQGIEKQKDIVFVSAGVGITPFYSIVKSIKNNQNITMIHSARSTVASIISNMFTKLVNKKFKFITHLSDINGRIDKVILSKYISIDNNSYYYLCGSESFMENIYKILVTSGISKRHIKIENFTFK